MIPYNPRQVVVIEWPFSKQIMNHPEARLILDNKIPNSYIISSKIWEKYKNNLYYITLEDIDSNNYSKYSCLNCGNFFSQINIPSCKGCS